MAVKHSKQVADIFSAWSHYAQGCRRKAKMLLVAGQHYTVGRLQRAVVLAWQKAAAHERRATVSTGRALVESAGPCGTCLPQQYLGAGPCVGLCIELPTA